MRRALELVLLMAVGVIGCSWWVDPQDEFPLCERGDQEVCPMGLRCVSGRCQPNCVVEVCGDNVDNDCDGITDEVKDPDTCGDNVDNDCDGVVDEGSDPDNDGYTWCGNTVSKEGGSKVDCDPYNKLINPGATEVCDGRDNDCDFKIDEAPSDRSLCGPGEECNGSCIAANCPGAPGGSCAEAERCADGHCVRARQCGSETCGDNERCDAESMRCVRGLLPEGTECGADEDCASQSCIRAAALRLAATTNDARVCGRACCSDGECGEGQRCFASGTGARSCLPARMIPAEAPAQCSTDAACSGQEICALNRAQSLSAPTFLPHSELITSTCRTPQSGSATLGQRCSYYGTCASRICVARPGVVGQLCSTPCGSTKDCRAFEQAARKAGVTERAYCRYSTVSLDSALRVPDYAPVCVIDRRGETGPGGPNEPCASARDCLDGGCVGATATRKGRCAPTCCNDEQCGRGEDGRPIHCRPFPFGATYEMRCDLGVDL